MEYKILDILSIKRQKNGMVKIILNKSGGKSNIYKLLFQLGFRQSILDKEKVYYQKKDTQLQIVTIHDARRAFKTFLESANFSDLPKDITYNQILEWYLGKYNIIAKNAFYEHYLSEELADNEKHQLRLQTDYQYAWKFKISQKIEKFKGLGFTKTIDKNSNIDPNSDLYYKKINNNKYIIFSHYGGLKVNFSGIDAWSAIFRREVDIGVKKPIKITPIAFDKGIKIIETSYL